MDEKTRKRRRRRHIDFTDMPTFFPKPKIRIPCPVCKGRDTETFQQILDIMYFPNHYNFVFTCNNCGLKHNDFFAINQSKPMRHTYVAEGKEDWRTKVVQSSSGTLEMPQFGVRMEPGPKSQGRITNIEGILKTAIQITGFFTKEGEEEKTSNSARALVKSMEQLVEEWGKIEIILEDPLGNSTIKPENEAKLFVEELTEGEVAMLKSPYLEFNSRFVMDYTNIF